MFRFGQYFVFISFARYLQLSISLDDQAHHTERFCSKSDIGFCLDVTSGNSTSTQASDFCSNNTATLIDFHDSEVLEKISEVLSVNLILSDHLFALNARRGFTNKRMIYLDGTVYYTEESSTFLKAITLMPISYTFYSNILNFSSDLTWKPHKGICYLPDYICKAKKGKSTYDNRCFMITASESNWFEARRECLENRGDLAVFFPNTTFKYLEILGLEFSEKYWIGASYSRWKWNNSFEDVRWFDSTPKWSPRFPETETTKCASMAILGNLTSFRYKYGAHECDKKHQFSVICVLNGSYTLPMKSEAFPSKTTNSSPPVVAVVTAILVVLCACFAATMGIILYRKLHKGRSRLANLEDSSSSSTRSRVHYARVLQLRKKKTKHESSVPLNNLQYPDLNLPNKPVVQPSEDEYSTIPEEMQTPIYMNVDHEHIYYNTDTNASTAVQAGERSNNGPNNMESLYCLSTGDDAGSNSGRNKTTRALASPVILCDNEIYDRRTTTAKILKKLKIFPRSFSRNSSNESSEHTSVYEPLSPASLGSRGASVTADRSASSVIYSLETGAAGQTDDYARLNVVVNGAP